MSYGPDRTEPDWTEPDRTAPAAPGGRPRVEPAERRTSHVGPETGCGLKFKGCFRGL